MGGPRNLGASERVVGFGLKGGKARDRKEARRATEELNQNDRSSPYFGSRRLSSGARTTYSGGSVVSWRNPALT